MEEPLRNKGRVFYPINASTEKAGGIHPAGLWDPSNYAPLIRVMRGGIVHYV
jgi:hypothetical protein